MQFTLHLLWGLSLFKKQNQQLRILAAAHSPLILELTTHPASVPLLSQLAQTWNKAKIYKLRMLSWNRKAGNPVSREPKNVYNTECRHPWLEGQTAWFRKASQYQGEKLRHTTGDNKKKGKSRTPSRTIVMLIRKDKHKRAWGGDDKQGLWFEWLHSQPLKKRRGKSFPARIVFRLTQDRRAD